MTDKAQTMRLREFMFDGASVEAADWARESLRECWKFGTAHMANVARLSTMMLDPLFADSEAGERARRTIDFLQSRMLSERKT
mgnify:CR=1 FL=1